MRVPARAPPAIGEVFRLVANRVERRARVQRSRFATVSAMCTVPTSAGDPADSSELLVGSYCSNSIRYEAPVSPSLRGSPLRVRRWSPP